jgi:hypothetical protein
MIIPPTFRISMHLRCEYKVLMSYLNRHSTLRFVFVMYITCHAHGLLEMFRQKTSDSLPNKRSPVRETFLANLDTACFKFVFVGFFQRNKTSIRFPFIDTINYIYFICEIALIFILVFALYLKIVRLN